MYHTSKDAHCSEFEPTRKKISKKLILLPLAQKTLFLQMVKLGIRETCFRCLKLYGVNREILSFKMIPFASPTFQCGQSNDEISIFYQRNKFLFLCKNYITVIFHDRKLTELDSVPMEPCLLYPVPVIQLFRNIHQEKL